MAALHRPQPEDAAREWTGGTDRPLLAGRCSTRGSPGSRRWAGVRSEADPDDPEPVNQVTHPQDPVLVGVQRTNHPGLLLLTAAAVGALAAQAAARINDQAGPTNVSGGASYP